MALKEFVEQNTLNIASVSAAPDLPGIYAWYAEIKLGPPDWIEHIDEEQDLGEVRLRSALESFSFFFARQRLSVEARSHFNVTWTGDLTEDLARRLAAAESKLLSASLQSAARRELLVRIVGAASPVFSHPLYIGVADSLRTRLRQHSDEFFNLREAQRQAPGNFTEYANEQTFAQRAFRLGLKEENLTVHFTSIDLTSALDRDAVRQTLESAEWLLNHWSTPLLGRK
jgi:hypothetical protein